MCALACGNLCLFTFWSLYTSRNGITTVVGFVVFFIPFFSGTLFTTWQWCGVIPRFGPHPPHSGQSCGTDHWAFSTQDVVLTNTVKCYVTICHYFNPNISVHICLCVCVCVCVCVCLCVCVCVCERESACLCVTCSVLPLCKRKPKHINKN